MSSLIQYGRLLADGSICCATLQIAMQGDQEAHPLISAHRCFQPAQNSCPPEAPQPPPPANDAVPKAQQQVAGAEDKAQMLPSQAPPAKTPMSTTNTNKQAASKAQRYQEQAATAERDGQHAGGQSPVASEKARVMDMQRSPANHGTSSGSAVIQEPLPQQDMREPSSMCEPSDLGLSSSEAGGAGPMQINSPTAEAPGLVLQQQVTEPEPEPIAAEVHGLQQYIEQASDTADPFVNNQKAPVHRQQLTHCSQQAVTATKHSQKSCWRRYGRFWRWV